MAPNAKLVYVQGNPYYYGTYEEAVAATLADVVSNSWTFNAGEVPSLDAYWNLGKPLLFASGDGSAWPQCNSVTGYPCTSVYATCVGGTSLYLNPNLTRNA